MSTYHLLCIGARDTHEIETQLGSDDQSYDVTTVQTLQRPGTQLAGVDCVVAVHDPPTSDAAATVQTVRNASDVIPVVVYADDGSEKLAMETANAPPSRYVSGGDPDSPELLADAITDVLHECGSSGSPRRDFSPANIVHQLPTAAFVLNDQHEVAYWNEACANLLEADADEMLGTTRPFKAVYDESRPVLADLVLDGAGADEISRWYDEWYGSPYGEHTFIGEDYFPKQDIWLRFAATPLTDVNGDIVGAIETLEEITERKQRKRELERYETIIEASGDPVYTLDDEGTFTFVNDKLAEMTGYRKDELLGSNVSRVVAAETIEMANQHISELLRTDKQQVSVEMDIISANGDHRTCENHIALLPPENGRQGTVGVLRDITDRKARERELRQFENAVQHAGYAIMITNRDESIEYVNPAFEEMTGYTATEALGKTPAVLTSGEHTEAFYADIWETILDGDVWEGEIVNERKNGERFVVRETIAPILDKSGEIQGFVSIQDDITARRLREQQLDVFHRVLRHTVRNKGTAIKGHTDLLDQTLKKDPHHERLATIRENVEALIDISEKAHHVKQIVADALDDDANRELLSTLERMTSQIASVYPEAEVTVDENASQPLYIDGRATHALYELIKNGVRHSNAPTPQISVTVAAEPETTTVTIADNGPGIPSEEREVLKSGTETPLEHSSGLGLWFSHWLIHYVGGDIEIEVEESGTRVSVTLPVQSKTQS